VSVRIVTAAAALCALAACTGRGSSLPANVSRCEGLSASSLTATIRNDADRPIKRVSMLTDFYQNFRSLHGTATAVVPGELDPGAERALTFAFDTPLPAAVTGRATRCVVTRIDYLDGTSQTLPAGQ
jgi:hypothetical protein